MSWLHLLTACPCCLSHVYQCACCMSLNVHAACPCMSLVHVLTACSCWRPIHVLATFSMYMYVHAACPCTSVLLYLLHIMVNVHSGCPRGMSCYVSILHVLAACPCCMFVKPGHWRPPWQLWNCTYSRFAYKKSPTLLGTLWTVPKQHWRSSRLFPAVLENLLIISKSN